MMFQLSSIMGYSRKYLHTPHGWHWKSCKKCWLSSRIFSDGCSEKFFEGAHTQNFPGQTIPGGGNFFKENEIFTLES